MERSLSAGKPLIPQCKGSKVPSSLLFRLGVHPVFKSMPPTEFLRCNSETLPFPIPEGGQEPALNWRSAGSKAGPARQSGVGPGRGFQQVKSPWRINPLDFPQAKGESLRAAGPSQALLAETSLGPLGCLGKPSGHLHLLL